MVDSAGSLEKSIVTSILNNAKVCTKEEVLNQSLAMNPLLFTTKNQLFSRNRASLANLISTQVIKTIILKVVILARRYMIYMGVFTNYVTSFLRFLTPPPVTHFTK